MAWKLENIRKDPNSKELYADLFISQIKEEPKTACLFTIGDARTVEIILEKYKNTQFVVFDYPALIKFLDFAKPANLFKAIPLKYDWESEAEFLKFIEVEMQKILKEIEEANMSFDLIIANPPYGKRGTLATTLIKEFMKFAEECIVLCQPRSIEKNGVYEHVVKADIVDNIFDAGLGKLAVSKIRNGYTEGKQVLYGKREIQETDITFQVRKFNDSRLDRVAIMYSHCSINPVKYRDLVASGKLFLFGVFDMGHVVQDPNKTHGSSVDLNFYRRDLQWASEVHRYGNDCYAFGFSSKKAKENFRDVFFDIPKVGFWSKLIEQAEEYSKGMPKAESYVPAIDWEHLDESPLWQTSKEKAFLVELIKEGGQKIVLAYLKTKNENLDWSHPWTDEEILRELGLPKDFLGEKNVQ